MSSIAIKKTITIDDGELRSLILYVLKEECSDQIDAERVADRVLNLCHQCEWEPRQLLPFWRRWRYATPLSNSNRP